MNTDSAIVAITKKGSELGRRLNRLLPGSSLYLPEKFADGEKSAEHYFAGRTGKIIGDIFHRYKSLILIMATGIAVRLISRELNDKREDPGIVVIDEAGLSCISLLSGHLGGANELAEKTAGLIGARPVITTASDVSGTVSADMLGREYGWEIEDISRLMEVSAALVNEEPVGVYQDAGETDWRTDGTLPENITFYSDLEGLKESGSAALMIITDNIIDDSWLKSLDIPAVIYRPKSLVIGIGCNKNTGAAVIENAVSRALSDCGLAEKCIGTLATIDLKRNEGGILKYARERHLPVEYHTREKLRKTKFPSEPSAAAMKHMGTPSVCEGAALLSSYASDLLATKVSFKRSVTVAVARRSFEEKHQRGKLLLVGIGPGSPGQMTFEARETIDSSEVVIGYRSYIDLLEPLLTSQKIIATGMGAEVERVKEAVKLANKGRTVSLVSSGDTGIYGMAALAEEIISRNPETNIDIEIVPGITSLISGAALLGSPVSVDFAAISLSDYLIPWEEIVRRLELAARGDFVIALYNPRSKRRRGQLAKAREIVLKHRSASTPVGIVTDAYREGQEVTVTDLESMLRYEVGMNTTIIIGNSTTFTFKDRMITPRGYREKYDLDN